MLLHQEFLVDSDLGTGVQKSRRGKPVGHSDGDIIAQVVLYHGVTEMTLGIGVHYLATKHVEDTSTMDQTKVHTAKLLDFSNSLTPTILTAG